MEINEARGGGTEFHVNKAAVVGQESKKHDNCPPLWRKRGRG